MVLQRQVRFGFPLDSGPERSSYATRWVTIFSWGTPRRSTTGARTSMRACKRQSRARSPY